MALISWGRLAPPGIAFGRIWAETIASKDCPCRSIRSVCSTGSNASTERPQRWPGGPGMIRTLAGSFDHQRRIDSRPADDHFVQLVMEGMPSATLMFRHAELCDTAESRT